MKILFISTMGASPWGGSEVLWYQSAMELAQLGHQVHVSVKHWANPAPALQILREQGCRVHERKTNRILDAVHRRLGRYPASYHAEQALRTLAPDLAVISSGCLGEEIWLQACHTSGVPCAVVTQAVSESHWFPDEGAQEMADWHQKAAACFFVSERNLKLAETILATGLPNARVIRNPFNVRYDAVCDYPAEEPALRMACVARLEPASKGQDLLLEVLSLPKWRERNLEVSFYGNGVNGKVLQALARRFDLQSVSFPGHTANIEEIWNHHHLLILPSRFEGLPLALVEAMLCGRAAVVTDVAGNVEMVDDNETGFVAAAPTVALLDEAMERAWHRRADWAAMGAEAARRVRLRVPPDPSVRFTREILQLAGSHQAQPVPRPRSKEILPLTDT
ncbi:MAG: glycosyltransferase family 4 protein [Verrucomicrobiota bacterium]